MPTADTRGLTADPPPAADTGWRRGDMNRHFGDVCSAYRSVRDLDLAAVRLVSDVLASAAAQARPFPAPGRRHGHRAVLGHGQRVLVVNARR